MNKLIKEVSEYINNNFNHDNIKMNGGLYITGRINFLHFRNINNSSNILSIYSFMPSTYRIHLYPEKLRLSVRRNDLIQYKNMNEDEIFQFEISKTEQEIEYIKLIHDFYSIYLTDIPATPEGPITLREFTGANELKEIMR